MKNVILVNGLILAFLFAVDPEAISGQTHCPCLSDLARANQLLCSKNEDGKMSDDQTLAAMECLLGMKGNKEPVWDVTMHNRVSQTFGPSPMEVVALFNISALFYEAGDFADAMVLVWDDDDRELNSAKSISTAYKAYKKWFEKVKKTGLAEARRQKLDPLACTKVRWY